MENINSMATYYEQSLSGNIKSLTVCGLEINFLGGPAHKHAPGHKLQALKEQATS
jgi:hypothetical protein